MDQAFGIDALRVAVELLGGPTATAKEIGKSQSSVSEMLSQGKRVPAEWCIPLEKATGGKITRHELRPDLYPLDDVGPSGSPLEAAE